ncbi:exodeoxyribonuclease VII large subunit [Clostridiaceae bacterium AM27-36LB]|nr:exodeoxyribonuclease VII large subunit [Clostridiales bacterium AM23-16LB]RHR46950.1 exodeoxyribonuclease VII large subunit [Clostridiaceae bacterium AF18-31LB]RHT83182.1 exodeoxyribonuclease VII large subunit [Clostridiaceae bacterium AM27-36LB]RHW05341.1 exodeoxyribonuclease VII large subunit [Clostridiaceae bacterium OF09-1]
MAKNVYSVRQVNAYIKNMFVQDFMLNRIYVKGEVSNCKYHTSGHIYFSLKDESGAIACVMFAGERRTGLTFRMQEGQKVIVLGSVSVYERDGRYQLYAREILPDGEGDLYRRYEQLKRELEEMGMFSPEYKQPIPFYNRKIGIVTAPTGAAIRDIMNISRRRNPYVQLILYPALVQGEQAAESIVKGIQTLDAYGVDVMIVGRGGGSIEDLWAFNEEIVARAIFECRTPVISAVGHETDTTIADYVADLRAPTPSAAAELAVVDYRQLVESVRIFKNQLADRVEQKIVRNRDRARYLQARLLQASPQYQLREKRQYAADLNDKMRQAFSDKVKDRRHRLALYVERLDGCSPLKKLQQGYSYTESPDGKALTSITQVKEGDAVTIHVTDGTVVARTEGIRSLERNG